MSKSIIFVAILVFGVLTARLVQRLVPQWVGFAALGFLALGIVLGPALPLQVLSAAVLVELDLFVSIVLGLIGFVTGLRLRASQWHPGRSAAGAVSALLVIAPVAAGCAATMYVVDASLFAVPAAGGAPDALWTTLAIAAAAGVSSGPLAARVALAQGIVGARVETLREFATTGTATSLAVLGIAMAGRHADAVGTGLDLSLVTWAAIVVGFGVVAGVLFTIYLGDERDEIRMAVATIAVVAFAAGAGDALRVSPLFVGLVAGLAVTATSRHGEELQHAMQKLDQPLALLVMLFAGAYWRPGAAWVWVLPLVYAGIRWMVRNPATRVAVSTFVGPRDLGPDLGRALLGQGAFAAAIALGFAESVGDHADIVMTTVLGGMLVTDAFARRAARQVLEQSGDVATGGEKS